MGIGSGTEAVNRLHPPKSCCGCWSRPSPCSPNQREQAAEGRPGLPGLRCGAGKAADECRSDLPCSGWSCTCSRRSPRRCSSCPEPCTSPTPCRLPTSSSPRCRPCPRSWCVLPEAPACLHGPASEGGTTRHRPRPWDPRALPLTPPLGLSSERSGLGDVGDLGPRTVSVPSKPGGGQSGSVWPPGWSLWLTQGRPL